MTVMYKTEQEQQRRPAAPVEAGSSESVIDRYSQFNGLYCTERDLRIEGSVEGEIQCEGTVTVAPALMSRAVCSGVNFKARPMMSGTAMAPAYMTSTC